MTSLQSRLKKRLDRPVERPPIPICKCSGLKEKLSTSGSELAARAPSPNNPKMMAQQANMAAVRKQMSDATDRMQPTSERAHRSDANPDRITRGRATASAEGIDRHSSATRPAANCNATLSFVLTAERS